MPIPVLKRDLLQVPLVGFLSGSAGDGDAERLSGSARLPLPAGPISPKPGPLLSPSCVATPRPSVSPTATAATPLPSEAPEPPKKKPFRPSAFAACAANAANPKPFPLISSLCIARGPQPPRPAGYLGIKREPHRLCIRERPAGSVEVVLQDGAVPTLAAPMAVPVAASAASPEPSATPEPHAQMDPRAAAICSLVPSTGAGKEWLVRKWEQWVGHQSTPSPDSLSARGLDDLLLRAIMPKCFKGEQ